MYIKVGQMLSTRPDICPEYLMDEFEHLHAKVSVAPFKEPAVPFLEADSSREPVSVRGSETDRSAAISGRRSH